jgi:hypothetical protein
MLGRTLPVKAATQHFHDMLFTAQVDFAWRVRVLSDRGHAEAEHVGGARGQGRTFKFKPPPYHHQYAIQRRNSICRAMADNNTQYGIRGPPPATLCELDLQHIGNTRSF